MNIQLTTSARALQLIENTGRVKYARGQEPQWWRHHSTVLLWRMVSGAFEWNGEVGERPRFHDSIELEVDGAVHRDSLAIPEGAILRWPSG